MTCSKGKHIMDPSWPECPYCRSEGLLGPKPPLVPNSKSVASPRLPTMVEAGPQNSTFVEGAAPRPLKPFTPQGSPQSGPQLKQARTATEYSPAPPSGQGQVSPPPLANARRVVGVLITYSWRPEGQIFPIREGRNLIGRDPDCEICILEDKALSGHNSHITFRQNFVVGDMVSMSGTDLNGVPIEEQSKNLPNYAKIRAGSTHFTFIMVKAPE